MLFFGAGPRKDTGQDGTPPVTAVDIAEEIDAERCLQKSEALLAAGRSGEAMALLRAAPRMATTRRQLADITLRASSADAEFSACVAGADAARDASRWADGERGYAAALSLYPAHAGYLVQQAHCLKEQGKFAEAEIGYRTALALGAAIGDVEPHLVFVGERRGWHQRPAGRELTVQQKDGPIMEAPPTREEVAVAFGLLTGEAPPDAEVTIRILRSCGTVRDVFTAVIRSAPFRAANRDLLRLIADGAVPV